MTSKKRLKWDSEIWKFWTILCGCWLVVRWISWFSFRRIFFNFLIFLDSLLILVRLMMNVLCAFPYDKSEGQLTHNNKFWVVFDPLFLVVIFLVQTPQLNIKKEIWDAFNLSRRGFNHKREEKFSHLLNWTEILNCMKRKAVSNMKNDSQNEFASSFHDELSLQFSLFYIFDFVIKNPKIYHLLTLFSSLCSILWFSFTKYDELSSRF